MSETLVDIICEDHMPNIFCYKSYMYLTSCNLKDTIYFVPLAREVDQRRSSSSGGNADQS